MPFTPIHMGPGIAVKAILQGSFSLMVFGWAQIVMDLQPLFVMITGEGHLHGFSHTYLGAVLLAILSALSGKYLSEIGLYVLGLNRDWTIVTGWRVAFISAFIGTFSHVLLDSIMHWDVEPFFPVTTDNAIQGVISIEALHQLCLYSGVVGGVVYFAVQFWRRSRH
ncbi:metal-dependent hydrolase [Marinobacter lacisalsi]|uniref:Metal-dependent hydrolase n=1 Tax=Marinobacter lacisalsi TaxID=475979 RepID=A0ABV8QLI1_9GAMM